jgi:hypothetical protein
MSLLQTNLTERLLECHFVGMCMLSQKLYSSFIGCLCQSMGTRTSNRIGVSIYMPRGWSLWISHSSILRGFGYPLLQRRKPLTVNSSGKLQQNHADQQCILHSTCVTCAQQVTLERNLLLVALITLEGPKTSKHHDTSRAYEYCSCCFYIR